MPTRTCRHLLSAVNSVQVVIRLVFINAEGEYMISAGKTVFLEVFVMMFFLGCLFFCLFLYSSLS